MAPEFDKGFWERQWQRGEGDTPASMAGTPPSPYLEREVGDLEPGTALDAGCGGGAEALWLASRGWQVTAVDISSEALGIAAERAAALEGATAVQWVEADLTDWDPGTRFDLVTTHYAHPAMPQLEFYDRIAGWVAPGGTLLIVGHLHAHGVTGHGHHPPSEASATSGAITDRLAVRDWVVVTAEERIRSLAGDSQSENTLHDVVVRAERAR